jgi:predicted HTH transcriptional regulator
MNLPKIATIDDINELIAKRYIESEIFDFKGIEFRGLYKDICAMANNVAGGQLVLGVDENKTEFTKNGFKQNTEDTVNQQIGSNLYKVEPTPKMDPAIIHESDGQTFYVVLQILGENIDKPSKRS